VETQAHIKGVRRLSILRVPVDIVPEESLPEIIGSLLANNRRNQIVLIRLRDLMRARRDREFRKLLVDAALVIPITKGIVRGARFLQHSEPVRYMPFDFVIRLLGILEERRSSLYLLGMERKNLRVVEQNLRETFPGIRMVGRYNGFYPREVEIDIITAIKKASPDFLLAGNGISGRNKWIYRHRDEFHPGIYLWSGEVLDMFADRRRKPSRRSFQRGWDEFPDIIRRPWRLLRGFMYLWYAVLLLVYRIFRRH